MLQSYNSAETGQVRFPLDAALVSGNRDNCEHILRSNIAALLDWCRDVKGMTTGTLSNANFTIPTLFGYEEFVGHSREFDDIDENNMKPEVRKLKREIHGDWHVIDLGKSSNRIPSFVPGQNSRETDEAVWNVFDSLSKLKLLLTQSLLESLGGNVATSEDAIPSIKSHPLRSNVVDIIEELKSVENEKGFILAASLPAFELNSALDFLQHEGSEDTLLVVIGVCSHDSKPVPFFAQGPSSKMLREAIAVWNVPAVINTIIANGCQDCKISRHDLLSHQAAALNIVPHNVADLRRTPRGAITKRMLLIQPTEEMSKQIREELNENVTTREKDVEIVKEWLSKQPHLPEFDDDYRLMTFLRGSKFSLEKCKKKLDMYFTMRTAIPEFFCNRDITRPELREITKVIQVPPLPGLTKNGRRVIVMRGIDKDLPTPNIAEAMKLVLMIGDVRLKEELVGVAGDVYILDASVATPSHFAKFTPSIVKKFLVCVQEAYPVKLKEVHVVNISPLVDTIVNFVKPFLKEKIRNRIFMHSDMSTLYKYIPREILPSEYGGDAGPIQDIHETWVKKLEEYGPWFAEQESIKANEALRPGKPKTHDDLFGLDGSFRQLVID